MAITFTGSKTVTTDLAPHLTAAQLTTLLAIAPENMTLAQVRQLEDAASRHPKGSNPANTLSTIFA
jgi:hypothetical protein